MPTIKIYHEFEILVDVTHYFPGREAPFCRNPDDPRFSDPGDGVELEYDLYFIFDNNKEQKRIKIPDDIFPDDFYLMLEEQIENEMKEYSEPDYPLLD